MTTLIIIAQIAVAAAVVGAGVYIAVTGKSITFRHPWK